MVDVETLEVICQPRGDLGESAIRKAPVWHHPGEGGEDVEWGGDGVASTIG